MNIQDNPNWHDTECVVLNPKAAAHSPRAPQRAFRLLAYRQYRTGPRNGCLQNSRQFDSVCSCGCGLV